METTTILLKTYPSRQAAELAQIIVESQGIDTILVAGDAGGMRPDLGLMSGGVALRVAPRDFQTAHEILKVEETHSRERTAAPMKRLIFIGTWLLFGTDLMAGLFMITLSSLERHGTAELLAGICMVAFAGTVLWIVTRAYSRDRQTPIQTGAMI